MSSLKKIVRRKAGFEVLVHIGELQRITHLAHYNQDNIGGKPRKGWAEVLLLKDPGKMWPRLGQADATVTPIDSAVDKLRKDWLIVLAKLD